MFRTWHVFILTSKKTNNLIKSTFRKFSDINCKSKAVANCICFKQKCFLQTPSFFDTTQKHWLSKVTGDSLIKDLPTVSNSFLDGIFDGDSVERKNEVLSIVKLLMSHGCSEDEIKSRCLHYIKDHQSSYYKIKLLFDLNFNIVELMPLLSLNDVTLGTAVKNILLDKNMGFPHRIEYLSNSLKIKPYDLIPKLAKNPSLLTLAFETLQHRMEILKKAKINSEYLAKDHWIFNYNEKFLEDRIFAASKAKVELKPWMLRCSKKIFESTMSKRSQTQFILNGDDIVTYLAKKLDCSEEYVKVMMEKNKLLKTINIPKIEQVLDFLFDKGYTPQEVRLFPRVFCSSVQSLNKRFEVYREIKATLPTISQLCLASKIFETRCLKNPAKIN